MPSFFLLPNYLYNNPFSLLGSDFIKLFVLIIWRLLRIYLTLYCQ